MKNYFLLLPVLLFVAACDAPQRSRMPTSYENNNYNDPTNASGSFNPADLDGSNNGTTTPGGTTGGTTSTSPGFENCDLSDKHHTIDIGFFGLCQSSQDETSFKFRTSLSSNSVRICLIPTYKDANGASTYIGNPQCTKTEANQIFTGKLYKDRPGFSTYPINGVIVMKEPLLPEYIGCMQGYTNWPGNACPMGPSSSSYCGYWMQACPYGSKTGAACDGEARNYMGNICSSFKTKYSNSYIDIRTK